MTIIQGGQPKVHILGNETPSRRGFRYIVWNHNERQKALYGSIPRPIQVARNELECQLRPPFAHLEQGDPGRPVLRQEFKRR